ncbi:MAG: PLP-dependent aminotransferase family protein, partial [Bryobacteraceae bacterium]
MRTRDTVADLTTVKLDWASGMPLYRQLYEVVRQRVLDGTLAAGARLPAARVLMKDVCVSRNTVLAAFHQLIADGHLLAKPGSGVYVAERASAPPVSTVGIVDPGSVASPTPPTSPVPQAPLSSAKPDETLHLPTRASILAELPLSKLYRPGPPRPFRTGAPDSREFPLETWERLRARALREGGAQLLNAGDPAGYFPLREALAGYLREARDIRCTADQIVVTAGAQTALRLIGSVLASPGDVVAIEEPGYFGAKAAFLDAGARVAPLLVDEEGAITPAARRHNTPVLVYTTPAHQFPLGFTMTSRRRLGMLDFAVKHRAWVVEDDYDSELRYDGRPPLSLLSLDRHGRAIYVGSTSSLLFPTLRIGYLVLPATQVGSFVKANAIAGGYGPLVDQATLALFITEGHLAHHVSRVKQVYQRRLAALRQAVQRDLPDIFEIETGQAGLNTVAWLCRSWEEEEVTSAAAASGLDLTPLGAYGTTGLMRPGVVFGFSAFTPEELQKAIARLALALRA